MAGLDKEDVRFQSRYSPFLCLDISREGLEALVSSEHVYGVEYDYPLTVSPELSYMTKVSRSKYIRDNYGLKGSGVGIGMIESTGLPDTTKSSYTEIYNKNFTRDTGVAVNYMPHAAIVASILVGKNNGCAPNAKLYVTYMSEGENNATHDAVFRRVEWLLGRTDPNVNIINMSAKITTSVLPTGVTFTEGSYDAASKWFDHIAMQHDVHFVKSSGSVDDPENDVKNVTSPGVAYNGITVGSYTTPDKDQSWETTNSVLSDFSCYLTAENTAFKPDLVAPGSVYGVSGLGSSSGTSNAAPMVAGIMAQLIGARPALATQQRALKAILLATAWNKLDSPGFNGVSGSSQIDNRQGAGKVDAKNARYTVNNTLYVQALLSSGSFPYTTTATFSASASSARVALVWLKRNKITGSHYPTTSGMPSITNPAISNLDLYVYAPNGTLVASSTTTRGNVEIVQFTPTVSGTYTIKVTRPSGTTDKDALALAWW